MVEVFRTNICTRGQALDVCNRLERIFLGYLVNFDLEDCDRIMRIRSPFSTIDIERVCRVVMAMGFEASVLSDDPAPTRLSIIN